MFVALTFDLRAGSYLLLFVVLRYLVWVLGLGEIVCLVLLFSAAVVCSDLWWFVLFVCLRAFVG